MQTFVILPAVVEPIIVALTNVHCLFGTYASSCRMRHAYAGASF